MTRSQERAFVEHWPQYGIEITPGVELRPELLYPRQQPLFLEIGFGNGDGLAETAGRNPEHNYLGIEVHGPGVGHLLIRAAEAQLDNLRVVRTDAVEVLRDHLPPSSLDGILLFFPDPWHKKRHNKRRIVNADFVDLCAHRLKPGGLVHMATDWEDYAQQMMALLSASSQFENTQGEGVFAPRPEERPFTRFEQRGQRLGHGVWDLLFRRI